MNFYKHIMLCSMVLGSLGYVGMAHAFVVDEAAVRAMYSSQSNSGNRDIKDCVDLIKMASQLPSGNFDEVDGLCKQLKDLLDANTLGIEDKKKIVHLYTNTIEQRKFFNIFIDKTGKFDQEKYEKFKDNFAQQLDSKMSVPTWKDLVVRAAAGDNWKALQGFNVGGNWYNTLAALPAIAGVKAVSKRLESSIDNTLGGVFYGTYRVIAFYTNAMYRATRSALFGYSRIPFEVSEVKGWRASVKNMLAGLNTIAKDADRIGSRDASSVLRNAGEESMVSEEWDGLLQSDMAELAFIASCIDISQKYYNQSVDRAIVHYAQQLSRLLTTMRTTILEKTKSYRDLGSTDTKQALLRLQSTIDKYFDLLLAHLSEQEAAVENQQLKGSNESQASRDVAALIGKF